MNGTYSANLWQPWPLQGHSFFLYFFVRFAASCSMSRRDTDMRMSADAARSASTETTGRGFIAAGPLCGSPICTSPGLVGPSPLLWRLPGLPTASPPLGAITKGALEAGCGLVASLGRGWRVFERRSLAVDIVGGG